ncbi:LysR family transcriptional regulator [Aliamphritea spongicola]|uniref:LysR family transcriptional regulator n=1 Tax=Aliamphritea spongicola TaxID=707589 RepID=UPI00196B892E|nr:LysR family transcriptional regulator [Aliamphritea spongicola]MBN3561498.1 LysR family transcriptional regulator [Aliamphritea spongicola]
MLDLNGVRIFVQVVDAGGFSAAGRVLGLPKSTISRKLSQLESDLGVRLLKRSTRSLTLTEQGSTFYQRCRLIVQQAQDAESEMLDSLAAPRGILRVSAPVEEGNDVLGPVIADYLMKYPEVELQLHLTNEFVDLVGGEYDVAVRAGELPDSSLIAVKLFSETMTPYASPEYLQKHGTPTDIAQLAEHSCFLYGERTAKVVHQFINDGKRDKVILSGRMAVNSLGFIKNVTLRGGGIGFLPKHLCKQEEASGELVAFLPEWRYPEGGVYAVYPHRKLMSPKVRSFVDHLREYFAEA